MGGLFGGGDKVTTSETTVPKWVEDIQKNFGGDLEWIRDEAKRMYEEGGTGGIPGMPAEWQDAEDIIRGTGEDALWDLEGIEDAAGGTYDKTGGNYESQYTDNVVDTTLAGMQRQAQRDQLKRDARGAAVGGTSNTRGAVGDAVAEQLSGMNMAEMEAKLRDDAFRFGTDSSFREREGFMGEQDFLSKLASQGAGLGMNLGGAIGSIGDKYFEYDKAKANEDQDALSWLGGMFGGANPAGVGAGQGTTTNTQPGPSTFSQILGAGSAILGGFMGSDENIKDFGEAGLLETPQGALDTIASMPDMERYSYKAGYGHRDDEHAGLRAQDIEKVNPDLVKEIDGVKHVDSYLMMNTVVQAMKELDARTRES